MAAKSGELTAKQRRIAESLAAGATADEAAALCGCSPRYVYKLKAENTAFQQALAKIEAAALSDVGRRLLVAGLDAIELLHAVVNDTVARDSARIAAARILLDNITKYQSMITLESRISALERKLQ